MKEVIKRVYNDTFYTIPKTNNVIDIISKFVIDGLAKNNLYTLVDKDVMDEFIADNVYNENQDMIIDFILSFGTQLKIHDVDTESLLEMLVNEPYINGDFKDKINCVENINRNTFVITILIMRMFVNVLIELIITSKGNENE